MEFSLRPSLRKKEEAIELQKRQSMTVDERETSRLEDRRDEKTLSAMWWMIGSGLSIFLGGFGIWHLDNEYCSTIRGWRREIGLPWGILLEGHGWWHIMTGIGAYFYITWGIWLRHCLNGRQEEYALVWPHLISLPEIVKAPDADGVSKKTGQKKTA
ncbi:hypothetical protein MMC14_008020 [Varicellaria rhodocarpa]|nr:hypothetical protein [Varicellaria rhodocarpa]